ncbi:DinB family protein [Flavobacterium orientale]|uniref:DinB-like domain-containing protein n=1 Tax=Flavobacterium orientale TaxID=1756020 RepID=A0A916XV30_9FLAO|nr:DinB family protein [Flavobacterium orientale]GGD14135.1 hypothetical protein GCM10011343_01490 [Flavobacterium orientale]
MNQEQLLEQCINRTRICIEKVFILQNRPLHELRWSTNAKQWNVLQCIHHLNLYYEFYNPEIEHQLQQAQSAEDTDSFKSGVIGGYFVKTIQVSNSKKMKAVAAMEPHPTGLTSKVLSDFVQHGQTLLRLFEMAKNVDLNKVKTAISLTKWIRLKLGDTFLFMVNHNERHVKQAERVLEEFESFKD